MRQFLAYLAVTCSIFAICINITRAADNGLTTDEIGILGANIEVPTKQDIKENITIITSIEVASKC